MAQAQLTIDLDAIAANWRALAAMSGAAACGAVVKADAYGLGIAKVAPALARAGARVFFVAQAEEAVPLRKALGSGPEIWVFAGYMRGDAEIFRQTAAMPLLNSLPQISDFKSNFPDAPCGLQLDTGMNRLGLEASDLAQIDIPALKPDLVMSHLACADVPDHPVTATQLENFQMMTAELPGLRRSLAATGGTVLGPAFHHDLTRPGIGLYGGLPFAAATPVVQLDIPVIQTRDVAAGEAVGYGADWIAQRPSRIATLSVGYADGLIRAMGGRAKAFAGGLACPVVGRASMDLLTVDVTDLEEAPITMSLLGPDQGIDALAEAAGTIGYEILTALGDRYERVYKGA